MFLIDKFGIFIPKSSQNQNSNMCIEYSIFTETVGKIIKLISPWWSQLVGQRHFHQETKAEREVGLKTLVTGNSKKQVQVPI